MEAVGKLKELNVTADEIDRMTKALKDEKFREMLHDYAEELSDPENRKRYEDEIKLLEQERGNTVEFIHPEPFRVIRTSVDGTQECFINICSNDKVSKPECKWGVDEGSRRGQYWSLPHSLHPGRENTDRNGRRYMIYDVVFHPDTLHIASKNSRFMDMVDSTAIEGIQKTFKVTMDKNNVRELKTKYKGTPQPCVIRNPIPGFKPHEASEKPDPLAFPYPDETKPTPPQTKSDATPKSFQIQPPKTKELTKPKYAVKYRSFIDLQDFRYSRDSAQSPRPKEIVVTVDLPLLKVVTDANLEVTEKHLLLESQKPAYRLDLPLAYPVDVDKGGAKFNKQKKQLIVTLPVLASEEALKFVQGVNKCGASDGEQESREEKEMEVQRREQGEEKGDEEDTAREEREKTEKEEEKLKSEDEENQKGKQQHGDCEGNLQSMQQHISEDALQHKWEDEDNSPSMQQSKSEDVESMQKISQNDGGTEENMQKTSHYEVLDKYNSQLVQQQEDEDEDKKNMQNTQQHKDEDGENLHRTLQDEKNRQNMEHLTKMSEDGCCSAAEEKTSGVPSFLEDKDIFCAEMSSENSHIASPETKIQPVSNTTEHARDGNQELTTKTMTPEINENTELKEETPAENIKMETEATPLQHSYMEESQATVVGSSVQFPIKNLSINPTSQRSEESSETPKTDEAKKPSDSGDEVPLSSVRLPTGSVQNEEGIDEDDLPTEELLGKPGHNDSRPLLPSVLLREIDEDGNEKVISDHSVSVEFIFDNSLMFELD